MAKFVAATIPGATLKEGDTVRGRCRGHRRDQAGSSPNGSSRSGRAAAGTG